MGTLTGQNSELSSICQVPPVFGSQQPAISMPALSLSLDILKSCPAPTLLNKSNSNHFLVALGSRGKDGQEGALSQCEGPGNLSLQVASGELTCHDGQGVTLSPSWDKDSVIL